jgi:hypothetical protein
VHQFLYMQLQPVLCLPLVSGPGDKPGGLNLAALADSRSGPDSCLTGQNQRDTRLNCPGDPGLLLPGAVFEPEPLPRNPAWGMTNRLDGNHLTGQNTLVLH